MHLRIVFFYVSWLMLDVSHAEETVDMETITITARPIGLQSIEHFTQPIAILNGASLKERQNSTIGETVSNIPGVVTSRYSPLASRPIIRGFSGPRVQVLENGMSSMDVSTVSVDHIVTIDPVQAEQIEIFRGPATLLYGSEAIGGLVNVVTNKIPHYMPRKFGSRIYSTYNSNSNESLFSWQAEGGIGKLALHLDAMHRNANDYDAANGRVINSYYDLTNFNIGSSWINDWGYIGLSFGRLDSTHGIPFNPEEPDELPFINTEQGRIDLSAQIYSLLPGINSLSMQIAYNDYLHTEFEDSIMPGTVFSNEQLDGRLELQHAMIGRFNGVLGSQFGYRDISARGDEAFLPKTNRKHIAFFLIEEMDINDSLHIELGGRYEYQHFAAQGSNNISHDMFSISTSIDWRFIEEMALGLKLGRSQRGPSAEELYANGPHIATRTFEIGQSGLDVETINSIDLSLYREQGWLPWNLSLFANYANDYIYLRGLDRDNNGSVDEVDATGGAPGEFMQVRYQQDDVVFYGFELTTDFSLYESTTSSLGMHMFVDYVRAQRTNSENLPRISPARIGMVLDYEYSKLDARFDVTRVMAQNNNGPLETDTGGYTVANLNINYDLGKDGDGIELFARVMNLLNENGLLHTSFIKQRAPIIGFSLIVGVTVDF